MTTKLNKAFIMFGDTGGAKHFDVTDTPGGTQTFDVNFVTPKDATVRFIVTASDRYAGSSAPVQDSAFPVGYILSSPVPNPGSFKIRARNCDNNVAGGWASFFWLAIAENGPPTVPVPYHQMFAGQPAMFEPGGVAGDHQLFPNVSGQIESLPKAYNFDSSFAPGPYPHNVAGRPLIFATANNLGCGVSPYNEAHNAAAVPIVQDNWNVNEFVPPGTPGSPLGGFTLNSCNSDISAGPCGFNWVSFQKRAGQPPQSEMAWSVDTGHQPDGNDFIFKPTGQTGDWVSAEVQFSEPFAMPPVVLVTPIVSVDQFFGPPDGGLGGCAPVPMAQNVTRFGFTLAARNSDTNGNGGIAEFDWVAFGITEADLLTTLTT